MSDQPKLTSGELLSACGAGVWHAHRHASEIDRAARAPSARAPVGHDAYLDLVAVLRRRGVAIARSDALQSHRTL